MWLTLPRTPPSVRSGADTLRFIGHAPKTGVMTHVSRPLIALLLGSVVFFAVWTVALKPGPSTTSGGGGSSSGAGAYQSAIDKAHQAVKTSDHASAAHGGTLPSTTTTPTATTSSTKPAASTAATKPAATTSATKPAASAAATKPATTTSSTIGAATASTAQQRLSATESALGARKVVALLFYNPAAADDQAVRQELAAVAGQGTEVVKLAVPLAEAGKYTFITQHVQLATSPTLLLIDRAKQATAIVGFADRFEIAQRVADALAVPAK